MNPKVGDLITLKQEYRDPTEEQGVMLILGQEKEWDQEFNLVNLAMDNRNGRKHVKNRGSR